MDNPILFLFAFSLVIMIIDPVVMMLLPVRYERHINTLGLVFVAATVLFWATIIISMILLFGEIG